MGNPQDHWSKSGRRYEALLCSMGGHVDARIWTDQSQGAGRRIHGAQRKWDRRSEATSEARPLRNLMSRRGKSQRSGAADLGGKSETA